MYIAERNVPLCLGVLVTAVLLLFSQAAITDGSDGRSMYEVTRSMVEYKSLAIEARYGFPGVNGKFYASHGVGLPLLAVLPYIAARPLQRFTGLGEHGTEAVVASSIPLITGLLVVVLYRLARLLGAEVQPAVLVAIGSACGTYLLAFSKEFFSEPLATLFVVLAMERALSRQPVLAGVAAAAGAVTRPPLFAFVPILIWRVWCDGGWRAAVKAAVPLCGGLALALGYNAARFGEPLQFGYAGLGFTTPLLWGLGGLFFHPDKTVLLFAPVIILVPAGLHYIYRINRSAFWLLSGNLMFTLLISAKWVDWYGGWVWGPRTLIPGIIPAIVPVALWMNGRALRRHVVVSLFVLGFLVSAPTLVVSQRAQLMGHPPPYGPSVLRQIKLIPETLRFTRDRLQRGVCQQGRYEEYVNTWQVHLICAVGQRGIWPAAGLSLLLIAAAAFSARCLSTAVGRLSQPGERQNTPITFAGDTCI